MSAPARKRERKSRALDPDIKCLRACVRAIEATSPRMRRANLEYLWDRYVTHAPKGLISARRKA